MATAPSSFAWSTHQHSHALVCQSVGVSAWVRQAAAASLVWVLFVAAGCTPTDPITFWQDRLARYIEHQGNGDPTLLRDQPDLHSPRRYRPSQITFAASPSSRYDVRGVLVGVRNVGTEPWYFFLVGTTRHSGNAFSPTEDVRLIAFTPAGDKLRWRVSPPHDAPLQQYRSGRIGAARAGASAQTGFPSPLDIYHLAISESVATVTEQRSGAKWRLRLPGGDEG